MFKNNQHDWNGDRCRYCGATKSQYDRKSEYESHAYQFIHENEEFRSMKFDVIIGNPPYQISDGGAQSSARPLYHLFVERAKKLSPRFICMITPSRWFSGGKGLDEFRKSNISDTRFRVLVDYANSQDCFPGVEIKGGVNYFLWDRDYNGPCEVTNVVPGFNTSKLSRNLNAISSDIFIRYNTAITILEKVLKKESVFFDQIVSTQKPYGLRTFVTPEKNESKNSLILYGNGSKGFISKKEIKRNVETIDKYKIFITMAYGAGEGFPHQIINKPFIGEPGSICTETYLMIGPFNEIMHAESIYSYMVTKFFRFLVMLRKISQHASRDVYKYAPLVEPTKVYNDELLYKDYNLTMEEIEFIENTIKPMENNYE